MSLGLPSIGAGLPPPSATAAQPMAARLWVLLLLQPLPAISLQQIEQSLGAAAASVGFSEMECQMHTLALRFAKSRQPAMSSSAHRSLADALHLEQLCGTSPLPPPPQSSQTPQDTPAESEQRAASGAAVVYVATNGSDAAAGTQQLPFRSLLRARNALRSLRRVSDKSLPSRASAATVVLRGGKYFLNATLELTALDSWTTWRSFAGERVVLSGGLIAARLPGLAASAAPSDRRARRRAGQHDRYVGPGLQAGHARLQRQRRRYAEAVLSARQRLPHRMLPLPEKRARLGPPTGAFQRTVRPRQAPDLSTLSERQSRGHHGALLLEDGLAGRGDYLRSGASRLPG